VYDFGVAEKEALLEVALLFLLLKQQHVSVEQRCEISHPPVLDTRVHIRQARNK
jgi:hypothetical protein